MFVDNEWIDAILIGDENSKHATKKNNLKLWQINTRFIIF